MQVSLFNKANGGETGCGGKQLATVACLVAKVNKACCADWKAYHCALKMASNHDPNHKVNQSCFTLGDDKMEAVLSKNCSILGFKTAEMKLVEILIFSKDMIKDLDNYMQSW